jgi:GNAT superfamily N-acetyltransferase
MTHIHECQNASSIQATFAVMRQLRPHLDADTYADTVLRLQAAHGFRLLSAVASSGQCVGVAGFTVETRLYAGKMLYVADLVVDEAARSGGVGKALLAALKAEAARLECACIELDSGTHRAAAHKFYFREGFHIASFNFFQHCS